MLWALSNRIQADKDIIITLKNMGMGDMLDRSTDELYRSSKIGIDDIKQLSDFLRKVKIEDDICK